jgi:hypothetical protein
MTTAETRQQFVGNRLIAAGYHSFGAFAVVGNGCGESGAGLDSTFNRVHADHGSGGFLEWRDSAGAPRKTRLAAFADAHQIDRNDLGIQVDYAIWELGKYFPWLDAQLRNPGSRTIANLTANFCDMFENPAKATEGLDNRIAHAEAAYATWKAHQQLPAPLPVPAAPVPVPAPSLPVPGPPDIPASWAARISFELDQLTKLRTAYREEVPTPFDEAIASLEKLGNTPLPALPKPEPGEPPVQPQRKQTVFGANWVTSIFGTGSIAGAIVTLGIDAYNRQWPDAATMAIVMGLFSAGMTGINAKDKNVTGGSVPQTAEAKNRAVSPPIK